MKKTGAPSWVSEMKQSGGCFHGNTPLLNFVQNQNIVEVSDLFEGPDVDYHIRYIDAVSKSRSALFLAVIDKNAKLVDLLLKHSAAVFGSKNLIDDAVRFYVGRRDLEPSGHQSEDYICTVSLAAYHDNLDMLKKLLQAAKGQDQPLYQGVARRSMGVLNFFFDRIKREKTDCMRYLFSKDNPYFEQMLEHARDALKELMRHSSVDYFRFILDVLAKNKSLRTAGDWFSILSSFDEDTLSQTDRGFSYFQGHRQALWEHFILIYQKNQQIEYPKIGVPWSTRKETLRPLSLAVFEGLYGEAIKLYQAGMRVTKEDDGMLCHFLNKGQHGRFVRFMLFCDSDISNELVKLIIRNKPKITQALIELAKDKTEDAVFIRENLLLFLRRAGIAALGEDDDGANQIAVLKKLSEAIFAPRWLRAPSRERGSVGKLCTLFLLLSGSTDGLTTAVVPSAPTGEGDDGKIDDDREEGERKSVIMTVDKPPPNAPPAEEEKNILPLMENPNRFFVDPSAPPGVDVDESDGDESQAFQPGEPRPTFHFLENIISLGGFMVCFILIVAIIASSFSGNSLEPLGIPFSKST